MFSFLKDVGNYDKRVVGRDDVKGLTISTAYTSDEGYETAIIDANGVHPVERYESKEDAQSGHIKWVKESETITEITKLGWLGVIEPNQVKIERLI